MNGTRKKYSLWQTMQYHEWLILAVSWMSCNIPAMIINRQKDLVNDNIPNSALSWMEPGGSIHYDKLCSIMNAGKVGTMLYNAQCILRTRWRWVGMWVSHVQWATFSLQSIWGTYFGLVWFGSYLWNFPFFGFFLLYTDCVPIELLHSAALLWRESWDGGGHIVFLNLTTII
jgi:hypothetical protein